MRIYENGSPLNIYGARGPSYGYGAMTRYRPSSRVTPYAPGGVARYAGRAAGIYAAGNAATNAVGGPGLSSIFRSDIDFLRGKKSWKDLSAEIRAYKPGGALPSIQRGFDSVGNWLRGGIRSAGRSLGYRWKDEPMKLSDLEGRKRPLIQSGPGPSKRARVTTAKRPMMRIAGKRRYAKSTHGNYGGSFSGKRKYKTSKASLKGCVLKSEWNGTLTDVDAVYVGHNSHPIYHTLRAIGWAIMRLVAKKWGQDFNDFSTPLNGKDVTAAANLRITLSHRNTYNGVITDSTWLHGGDSWATIGDNIMHKIISNCGDSDTFYEIVQIKFANYDATAIESLQTVIFRAQDLKILVSGFSHLRVQNQTVGAVAEDGKDASKDDVVNNPLVGRQYFGSGQYHAWNFNNDYTTSVPTFYYSAADGALFITPGTATSIDSSMANSIKKPPPHKFVKGTKASMHVKLMPGQIKTSTVKFSYKKSLNGWIKYLFPVIRAATTLATLGSGHPLCSMGKNSFLGFEHMLHTGTEPDITLGYQCECSVSGIASYYRKVYCNPDYEKGIGSVVLEEDPAVS